MTVQEMINAFDRQVAGKKIATKQKNLCVSGDSQYVGRPQGPKAKGHKTPATGVLPYTRFSVVPK